MNEYKLGSYDWYINSNRLVDGAGMEPQEWLNYQREVVRDHLNSFELEPGQQLRVKVGGGARQLWYKGEVVFTGFNKLAGAYLVIKQPNQNKYIDAWRIIDIELLDRVKA